MKKHVKILVMVMVSFFYSLGVNALDEAPVVLLVEAKGDVQYSPDGEIWKTVHRNKFLFENWRVKTGENASCMLLNQGSEMLEPISSSSELEIHAAGTKMIRGTAPVAEPAKELAGFFKRKFASIQKYTSIKRYGKQNEKMELLTARNIVLSKDYPDLVWDNAGAEYDYQLLVGEKVFEVPGSKEHTIRFRLSDMKDGCYPYTVQVLFDGEIVYAAKKNRLCWLSDAENRALQKEQQHIIEIAPENGFLMGSLLDERGLKVAALDEYRHFLAENPDDGDEIRPLIIKILWELKLTSAEKTEMENIGTSE